VLVQDLSDIDRIEKRNSLTQMLECFLLAQPGVLEVSVTGGRECVERVLVVVATPLAHHELLDTVRERFPGWLTADAITILKAPTRRRVG